MDVVTFTVSGILSLALTTAVGVYAHFLIVREVGKLTKELEEIKLINQTTLQTQQYNLENRRKAEIVAELFALWSQSGPIARRWNSWK
jgi:hypothetical protein